VAGRDITEGRATRAIAVNVGIDATTSIWQNTDIAYDTAIGGMPFIYAISDSRPYIRQTAPFRKDQFDNQTEPGEQSLTGWWIRSQSSFHYGDGITFYDPTSSNSGSPEHYRYAESKGLNVWDIGQVTLLNDVDAEHFTTGAIDSNGRVNQQLRSIKWSNTSGVLLKDDYNVEKIASDGTVISFINYSSGTDSKVYAICDDGISAFWATNVVHSGSNKLHVYKKALTADYSVSETLMFRENGIEVTNGVMEYVKDRIVMAINNKVYEFSSNATNLTTALYTHPSTSHVYTSIAASGTSIYVSGYNGIQSTILKFTLSTAGVMPTLTSAVIAAEFPVGEIVHKIYYYLGYMIIGTNLGVRVAQVSDDGSINYGPLIVETSQPCYDFASRDHYVWCATSVDGEPGVIRIDLSAEIETLRFAWANDLYYSGVTGHVTTACAFANSTDQLWFATSANSVGGTITNKEMTSGVATLTTASAHGLVAGSTVWVEGVDTNFNSTTSAWTLTSATTTTFTYTSAVTATVTSAAVTSSTALANVLGSTYAEDETQLAPTGYLQTGFIRYNTLEPKNYKRLVARGDFTKGSMTLETVDANGIEYDHISYDSSVPPVEVSTNQPQDAQEYVAYKFIFYRDGTTASLGPIMKGYQAKATIATPRQRVMRFPVYCYDVETDRYNVQVGYEGRAFDRISQLESIEENGDVVTWQDLTTGESRQCVIEQISFTRLTPPDRGFTGYGGVIDITIRTV
jgi:hypothetical protein